MRLRQGSQRACQAQETQLGALDEEGRVHLTHFSASRLVLVLVAEDRHCAIVAFLHSHGTWHQRSSTQKGEKSEAAICCAMSSTVLPHCPFSRRPHPPWLRIF
jgi:hypothetical protein